uniref:Uncharacterized protein n=1 Tax=Glossina austeni TaxID=7395 RepID=A0A1A9VEQ3_GLOAU
MNRTLGAFTAEMWSDFKVLSIQMTDRCEYSQFRSWIKIENFEFFSKYLYSAYGYIMFSILSANFSNPIMLFGIEQSKSSSFCRIHSSANCKELLTEDHIDSSMDVPSCVLLRFTGRKHNVTLSASIELSLVIKVFHGTDTVKRPMYPLCQQFVLSIA